MKLDISKLHLDILDNSRRELLQRIIPSIKEFVLGGGTALSFQIAHRQSFDFDFFSEQEISRQLLEKLSSDIEIKEVVVDSTDELTFFGPNNVKCTFLYYHFKSYFEPIEVSNGLIMFSVPEIAVKKAYTIGRRGVYRDYFDLYSILIGNSTTLQEIITIAEKIYKGVFNSKLFLEQLVYFNDLPDFDIESIKNERIPSPEKVKQQLERIVFDYIEKK